MERALTWLWRYPPCPSLLAWAYQFITLPSIFSSEKETFGLKSLTLLQVLNSLSKIWGWGWTVISVLANGTKAESK